MDRVKRWAWLIVSSSWVWGVAFAVNVVMRWRGLFGADATRAQWWCDFGLQCAVMGLVGYMAASVRICLESRAMRKRVAAEVDRLVRGKYGEGPGLLRAETERHIARSNELTAKLRAATDELENLRAP